ncbi:uncharacterized protein LOC133213839 isoform X2 [Neopsephotus bourkii]|uniref:uncharacterized protein LOC133213839 isoform X2 n=1 Tax=Neopsephotus bourkii TaxID=309878 RepID=UPI002AA4FA16|nr:uncharacterized protein LOC133213839 isoform X2 [Neopsephotus bourkii]
MEVVKGDLCRSRHQETIQQQVHVHQSPEGAQQLCSPVQLGQGREYLSSSQMQSLDQQPQGRDNVHVQLQRQATQGSISPNMGPQETDQGWEATEVTVQVYPQKMSQGLESPEVTVNVRPQKPSPRWEAPSVTVQVQLQQSGQGPALPQVTVQVQPQERGRGMAGIKVTVQLQWGHDQEEAICLHDQGEEVLGNGEQLVPKQNWGETKAKSEGESGLDVVEQVPQGALSQKQDQGGEVTKLQQDQSQEEGRVEVVELQEVQVEDNIGQDGMVTEEQTEDQSQEQEQLKGDLPPQEEGPRATERRQGQGKVQEWLKGKVKDQKEDLGQDMSKKHPRETPNYFVAIPITDDQILDRIEDVQELIFTKEPDLLRALLPVQTMHLTIIVAHLGTEEEIKKAVLALKQSKTKVEAILQGKNLNMTFHGIGQFNNQVIYVKMLEEDQKTLSRIAAVEECFIEMNLDVSGSKDFKPHLTFLKLSKAPRLKRKGFRKICSDLYKEYENSYFGTEVFRQIDLCAMRKKKQQSGYYYCECSINVGSSSTEESKEQEVQTDVAETSEDLPNSAAEAEIGASAARCKLASTVAADDKPPENVAEALIASKKNENEMEGQPEAADGILLAAGEICSESVLGLLPASSDALKSMEKEQESAEITDGSLQKTEATEYAPDEPTSS